MNLSFTKDGEYGILTLSGDFEKLTTGALKKYLERVVDQACPYMIVDLRGVKELSVSGLGLIFAGKNRLDDVGTLMALVGPTRQLNRLLSPDSLEKMVPLCESIERAKIALRKLAFERKAKIRRRKGQHR